MLKPGCDYLFSCPQLYICSLCLNHSHILTRGKQTENILNRINTSQSTERNTSQSNDNNCSAHIAAVHNYSPQTPSNPCFISHLLPWNWNNNEGHWMIWITKSPCNCLPYRTSSLIQLMVLNYRSKITANSAVCTLMHTMFTFFIFTLFWSLLALWIMSLDKNVGGSRVRLALE